MVLGAGCARAGLEVASQVASDIEHGAACGDLSEKVSSTIAQALIDRTELPSTEDVRASLAQSLGEDHPDVVEKATAAYDVVVNETREQMGAVEPKQLLQAVMALEIGDETTPVKARLKTKIRAAYQAVRVAAQADGLECPTPSAPISSGGGSDSSGSVGTPPTTPQTKMAPVSEGAVRVLRTAYQSCQSARLPAMTASTAAIADGAISIVGRHADGVGSSRVVGNLKLLTQTHYYIREGIEKDPSCFDVTKNPLIYDYGGKPSTTAAVDSSLNLFKDGGDGTAVLGIDCSGYVFSALAVSGLRVSPTKRLTAALVHGISSTMYMEPTANGLSCLAPVPSRKDDALRDGDILAIAGHVVIIDRVGTDPFGINRLRAASDCVSANVSVKNFDFDVLQSSPVKGGIGIDRMRASDYLPDTSAMRLAMIDYAVAACKARFGSATTIKPSTGRLVRHKLTSECMDRPVALERESCVKSCPL